MPTAFQATGFQNNAFQVTAVAAVTTAPAGGGLFPIAAFAWKPLPRVDAIAFTITGTLGQPERIRPLPAVAAGSIVHLVASLGVPERIRPLPSVAARMAVTVAAEGVPTHIRDGRSDAVIAVLSLSTPRVVRDIDVRAVVFPGLYELRRAWEQAEREETEKALFLLLTR